MKHLTTVPFLLAALLFSMVPANAAPPNFNGNITGAGKPWYDVSFYGAKCDGTTDDGADINSAITAAKNAGGGVVYLPAICATSQTIVINSPDVVLVAPGADTFHNNATTWSPKGGLKWIGAAGGTLLEVEGVASGLRPGGVGVHNVALENPSCTAGYGLVVDTVAQGDFDGITFDCFSVHALAVQGTISVSDVGGTQHSIFSRLVFSNSTNTGDAIYLFTASHNDFEDVSIDYKNGNGIDCSYADFNNFINVRGFRETGGTGYGVALNGGTCYSNRFYDVSPGSGLVRAYSGSWNTVYNYDNGDNGFANPTIDTAGPSVSTTIATGFSAGTQTVTPGAMTNISVGSELRIDNGTATQEDVVVTATTASTFTANFLFAHGNGVAVAGSPAAALYWTSDMGGLNGWITNGLTFQSSQRGYSSVLSASNDYIASAGDNGSASSFLVNVPTGAPYIFRFDANGSQKATLDTSGVLTINGLNDSTLTGTTVVCADGSKNLSSTCIGMQLNNGTNPFASTSAYIVNNNDNGGSSSIGINVASGAPEILRFYAGGTQKGVMTTAGGIAMNGTVTGAHNACGSSSGTPCEAGASCSLSSATTCNATTTVPSGSVCTATPNSADTTSAPETLKITLSSNTLTVGVTVGTSQTATAAMNITCL